MTDPRAEALREAVASIPRLRLTGEQLDGIDPAPPGAEHFSIDWDEYDEFVPWSVLAHVLALPTEPALGPHSPGDPHQYRLTCSVCGQGGFVRLSIEPQTVTEGKPSWREDG